MTIPIGLSLSPFLPMLVSCRERKRERDREEVWKKLEELRIQHDQKRSQNSGNTSPEASSSPMASVVTVPNQSQTSEPIPVDSSGQAEAL